MTMIRRFTMLKNLAMALAAITLLAAPVASFAGDTGAAKNQPKSCCCSPKCECKDCKCSSDGKCCGKDCSCQKCGPNCACSKK
jgi:hypothetical protein